MLPQFSAKLTRGSGFRREKGYSAVGMISLDRNWAGNKDSRNGDEDRTRERLEGEWLHGFLPAV